MTDYTKLVEALRHCGKDLMHGERCKDSCPYGDIALCLPKLKLDAAAAIEELDAEETRLLLLTSDLQDKLMDLQAEVNRLELDNEDYEHENRRLHGEIEELQAQLPKRGKWVLQASGQDCKCSVCESYWIPFGDEYDYKFCPNCGAKMTGEQDVE